MELTVSPSSLTNLEQAWFHLPVFKLAKYVTAPASVYSITLDEPKRRVLNPPVTTNFPCNSIPHASLREGKINKIGKFLKFYIAGN